MHFFRHDRGRPPHPDVLTPAEWRVLEHIRERRTNAEIAVRLGVSVNTVRTHVSSMLAKLEVADREELARWHGEPALASRTALEASRVPVALGPLAWLRDAFASPTAKVVATGLAVTVAAAAIVGIASVAPSMNADDEATPTPTAGMVASMPTPVPTETPSATPTPQGFAPTPVPKPRFEPSAEARTISGLFSDPQPTVPDEYRSLAPAPRDSFGPWNGEDVVLYDIEAMTETNLGVGYNPTFTPDGESLYWIAGRMNDAEGQELWVHDLDTDESRSFGLARHAVWIDADHFGAILPGGNVWEIVEAATGERTPAVERPEGVYASHLLTEAAGFRIEAIDASQRPYPYEYVAYRVVDLSGSLAPLQFDAFGVFLMPDGTLILVTPPVDFQPQVGAFATSQRWGMSNIFEVDPRTGDATFIASARTSVPNSPFAASERYIVWTENYCNINPNLNDSAGRTRIYDGDTGILTELDAGLFVTGITPDGELADGTFGPDALIDIESLTYTVKFPTNDRVWSDDYRYTAVVQTGGHGGPCGA